MQRAIMQLCTWTLLLQVFVTSFAQAQTNSLTVINTVHQYKRQIQRYPYMKMIALKKICPSIAYDLRYASKNNFMHRVMYTNGSNIAFLRKPAAEALKKVQNELSKQGLGLKVFDGYRPYSVTKKFWDLVKDERYVAHPSKGSNHNRGTAIDLTLIDIATGKELNMGTDFDNFTDSAHHSFKQLPPVVLQNREKLKTVMQQFGFMPISTEWWHYTYQSNIKFDVLDIPFKQLARVKP